MDSAQVGILKKTNEVSFRSLLEGGHCRTLEAKVSLEVLGDLTNQTLEGQLPDQEFGGFLVATDLTKSNSSWPVTMRLLHSSSSGGTLPGGLGGELFPWGLATGRFTSSLLGTSHFDQKHLSGDSLKNAEKLKSMSDDDASGAGRSVLIQIFPP